MPARRFLAQATLPANRPPAKAHQPEASSGSRPAAGTDGVNREGRLLLRPIAFEDLDPYPRRSSTRIALGNEERERIDGCARLAQRCRKRRPAEQGMTAQDGPSPGYGSSMALRVVRRGHNPGSASWRSAGAGLRQSPSTRRATVSCLAVRGAQAGSSSYRTTTSGELRGDPALLMRLRRPTEPRAPRAPRAPRDPMNRETIAAIVQGWQTRFGRRRSSSERGPACRFRPRLRSLRRSPGERTVRPDAISHMR